MSSSSLASGTPQGSSSSPAGRDGNNNFMNGAENMLKLALKKPKAWKWELTTSSSSPGIDFPKIQLFDSRTGELMIQVDKPDCVVKSEELENGAGSERSRSSQSEKKGHRYRRSRSSCIKEKVVTSGEYLSDVFEQLQNKGLGYKLATSASQYRVQEEEEEDRSLQKSKSANEVNGVKKKIRKSTSSRSSSILGRISEFYKSSTEEEPVVVPPTPPTSPPVIPEITVVEEPPPPAPQEPPKNKIYKLVRSNAGTLIVREESFHTQRSLRRRKLESEASIPEDEPHIEQRISLPTTPADEDIPTAPSYDTTIKEIDQLISKVMLSHTLQSVEEPPKQHSSSVRPLKPESKKRKSHRSASVGSAASRSASAGSRRSRRNSPRVTVLPGTSSEEEDAVSLAESRFGSLKRRGRPKYRRNLTGASPVVTAVVPAAEENMVERSREQETNAHHQHQDPQNQRISSASTIRIEECYSTISMSSSGTSRSRSKSSSTSVSTLSPPSEVGECLNLEVLEDVGSSETHQAAIDTLPEVHFERLNSIEQKAQVTEILNPRGTVETPTEDLPRTKPETPRRSKLNPDSFFNSYLAELRSLSAQQASTTPTSSISPEVASPGNYQAPRHHLATSQSASSLVQQQPKQKQYGRRHHRSSYLQLLP